MLHNYSKEEMQKTGIYKITSTIDGRFYIGSASCINAGNSKIGFNGRLNQHINRLQINKHANKILQNYYNKYGIESFIFEIVEICSHNIAREREQYYLDTLQPFNNKGFNICKNSLMFKGIRSKNRTFLGNKSTLNKNQKVTVIQKDLENNYINTHIGITEVSKKLGINRSSIYNCCRGKAKTAGGYLWEYEDNDFQNYSLKKFNLKITNTQDNSIQIFKNFVEVCKKLDYCKSTLRIHANNNSILENKYLIERIFL